MVATWISRIPAIQAALRLNNGVLGLTLLNSAAGALCAIPIAGWLIGRIGSRRTTIVASLAFCLSVPGMALAGNALALAGALFLFGAVAAAMGVSMNAQAVEVERALGKATMSRFHAMFSLGGMAGAGIGGLVAAQGISPVPHFLISALLNALAVVGISPLLIDSRDGHGKQQRMPWRNIPRMLIALSAIGFCSFLSEGAMADWIALYLRQVQNAGPGVAAGGYSVFSAAMATMRLLGDTITTRLGPRRTLTCGGVLAAAGVSWALVMHSPGWAMPGFALAGCGFSVIVPIVFGAGARVKDVPPGAGIATISGLGYIGFIVGPPSIGLLSQVVTLRYALLLVVVCCLVAAALARPMSSLDSQDPALVGRAEYLDM